MAVSFYLFLNLYGSFILLICSSAHAVLELHLYSWDFYHHHYIGETTERLRGRKIIC